ncbi:competence protein CoiA-like protein [Algoriphagus yeomjeoni]|uniref:Competence protein CoiA-like protein n=2 Tax=Algoriphagus yeomjeoni TaxID=291403 RepID=A0A327PAK5_9BACT|nr:competence protein CoiA-like protein [Algoriphagus yeomjeoni]
MGKFRRTIDVARCKETGEIFRASERFIETKEAFLYRRLYHEKSISFECIDCGQHLSISGSKNDKIHFKHFPDHDPCFLVQNKFNPEVQKFYERALIAKESERHKELKQKIGDRLAFVEGVEADSISVDDKFIIKGRDRRKPDVYCRYKGKELVFEIQLSELSLGYILSRHNFYKNYGIYLIWILDTYDIRDQGTKEKDLKYLSDHQNFFKLDESVTDFKLICDYKFPFLTKENALLTPWRKKSITLDQLSFDVQAMQTYFFDFTENLEKIKGQQIIKKEAIRVEEERKLQVQIENAAHSKAQEICLADQVAYDLCNRLDNRDLVDDVFYNQRLLLIFESINQRKIIGFNYGEDKWVSFANNAIEYYQNHWRKIELALRRAELWEMVIESDKKKTFSKKLEKWNSISPKQDNRTNELLFDLFPYLIFQ